MKLIFQEQIIELDQMFSVENVIESINKLLGNDFYFSHFLVDGLEVTEEPEVFLTKEVGNIEEILVIAIPAKEFINNLMLSIEEYVERAIPYVVELFDGFYNNPTKDEWGSLAELFEGIQWLSIVIDSVEVSVIRPESWKEISTTTVEVQGELESLEEALENNDTILIGDILQYEILPVLEKIKSLVTKSIDSEGERHDLS